MNNWIINQLEISHGKNAPLKAMEGLRGVAVFLVFLVHYSSLIEPWLTNNTLKISSFIYAFGHLGVDLFFILSGYLIYGTIITKQVFDTKKYIKRRCMRIYPTFLVIFLVYVLLSVLFPKESKLPSELLPLLKYLIQNILLLPGMFDIKPMITVAWSLSYEVFYYFLIPLLIFSLSMKRWKSVNRIIFWCFVAVFGFVITFMYGGPVRLLMFVSGILLYETHKINNIQFKWWGTTCFILSLIVFGFRTVIDFNYHLSLMIVFILFFVFCLNAFSNYSTSARWLIFSPLRWLGNMSYSYYLIHGLTLKFLFLILPVFLSSTQSHELIYYLLWIPFFMVTIVTSFILFILIERPMSILNKVKVGTISSESTRLT